MIIKFFLITEFPVWDWGNKTFIKKGNYKDLTETLAAVCIHN